MLWFNGTTLDLIEAAAFDTNADAQEGDASAALGAFIYKIPDGDIVMAGVMDEGTAAAADPTSFFKDTRSALESIGAKLWPTVKHRESFAVIGRKNAAPGSSFVMEDTGTAELIDPIGDFSDGCAFRSRPSRLLRMRYYRGVGGVVTAQAPASVRDTLSDIRALASFNTASDSDLVTIEAQSAGYCDGNSFYVWINGALVQWGDGVQSRGMNLALINPDTFEVYFTGGYDTHGDTATKAWPSGTGASDALAAKILDQPFGTIIGTKKLSSILSSMCWRGKRSLRAFSVFLAAHSFNFLCSDWHHRPGCRWPCGH